MIQSSILRSISEKLTFALNISEHMHSFGELHGKLVDKVLPSLSGEPRAHFL